MENNSFGRLIGVLVSPVKTFLSIAERPTWAVAFLALYLLGSGVFVLAQQKVDFAAGFRQQMAEQGRELPAGSEEKALPILRVSVGVAVFFVVPALFFLFAAICLLFNLLGGELDYKRSLAVVLHSSMPRALASLLSLPVILSRNEIAFKELQGGTFLHSNLSFLVPDAGPALRVLLVSCDLFTLWTLALSIVGFHLVAKVSKRTAAVTILVLVLLGVGFLVGLTLLGAYFGGKH